VNYTQQDAYHKDALKSLNPSVESQKVCYSQTSGDVQGFLLEVGALLSHACLNPAASADSSFFSGKRSSDIHCSEKGLNWM
jgi:hypothetical protein